MENASKALIIAGAILLAILLISLGIMIYQQASAQVNSAGMSDAELSAFNQKWTKYQGKQKGTMVRSLVQEVIANNNGDESASGRQIEIAAATGSTSVVTLATGTGKQPAYATNFSNTGIYTVDVIYDSTGRINKITVK